MKTKEEITKLVQNLVAQRNQIDAELLRLEGEYRRAEEEAKEAAKTPEVAPENPVGETKE